MRISPTAAFLIAASVAISGCARPEDSTASADELRLIADADMECAFSLGHYASTIKYASQQAGGLDYARYETMANHFATRVIAKYGRDNYAYTYAMLGIENANAVFESPAEQNRPHCVAKFRTEKQTPA